MRLQRTFVSTCAVIACIMVSQLQAAESVVEADGELSMAASGDPLLVDSLASGRTLAVPGEIITGIPDGMEPSDTGSGGSRLASPGKIGESMQPVPEPSTLVLVGMALLGFAVRVWKRR